MFEPGSTPERPLHMKITDRLTLKALVASTTVFVASNTIASGLFELDRQLSDLSKKSPIQTSLSSTFISFNVQGKAHGGTISITGPGGFAQTVEFSESSETVNLLDSESLSATNNRLLPGRYEYEITTHVGPLKLIMDTINNGRGDNNFTYAGEPVTHSGSFTVEGGGIKQFAQVQEPAPATW